MTKRAAVMPKEELWKQLQADLGAEFDHYVLGHPEVLEQIPEGAVLCFQLSGEEGFNRWSRRLAKQIAGSERPIVYVHVKELRPVESRITEVEITRSLR